VIASSGEVKRIPTFGGIELLSRLKGSSC